MSMACYGPFVHASQGLTVEPERDNLFVWKGSIKAAVSPLSFSLVFLLTPFSRIALIKVAHTISN
jgi:hypothetical protein